MIRVLEMGQYVAPAYAGMLLAEQGCSVYKVSREPDPIEDLVRGKELWAWINEGKFVTRGDLQGVSELTMQPFGIVLDNFTNATRDVIFGPHQDILAKRNNFVWVSLVCDQGTPSFDIIAQRRAWGDIAPYVPMYIGDTTAGLFMAFKALSMHAQERWGHYTLDHASLLMKLVEGELVVDVKRTPTARGVPWKEEYRVDEEGTAHVKFKGRWYREHIRDRAWKLRNLRHTHGRITL